MNRTVSFNGLPLAIAIGLVGSILSTAQTVALQNNGAPWVAHGTKIGPANDNTRVEITAYLKFRNAQQMKELATAVSTPGNPKYRQFLTPEQFRSAFAADPADVALVKDTLTELGFHVEYVPLSGFFVRASGTVAQVKSAFHVTQQLYSYRGQTLRASAEPPSVPARLANVVTFIDGIDETRLLAKPHHHLRNARRDSPPGTPFEPQPGVCSTYFNDHNATVQVQPAPYLGSEFAWFNCGYTPAQLRAAYGANQVSQTGLGVRVAIVDVYASPTIMNDANMFAKNHGLPALTSTTFTQILPPGILSVSADDPCGPQGWYTEETLDVESVHTMAPNASIVYIGASCTGTPQLNEAVYGVIDLGLADIVTNSWGYNGEIGLPPSFIATDDAEFEQAAIEGISVLFSTGDSGDLLADNSIASGSWPANSPWVTAVGGTTLALYNASGGKDEWGWGGYFTTFENARISNNGATVSDSGLSAPFSFFGGSGGGLSFVEAQPSYQVGIVPNSIATTTYTSTGSILTITPPRRVTPDIAMVADPYTGSLVGETFEITGNPFYDTGCTPLSKTTEYCELSLGGTSLASPLFAGSVALLNEASYTFFGSTLGWLNPLLYSVQVGEPSTSNSPSVVPGATGPAMFDVLPPNRPIALLADIINDPVDVGIITVNSAPSPINTALEGVDTTLFTTRGYDNVTGLGTPNIPALLIALGLAP